jgi:hypothetical protein
VAVGTYIYVNKWTLTQPIYNVKKVSVVWATFPHVAAVAEAGSDEQIVLVIERTSLRESIPIGSYVSSSPTKEISTNPTSTEFLDKVQGAFGVFVNEGLATSTTCVFRQNDYTVEQNYDIPLSQVSQISFDFYNSKGVPIGYNNTHNVCICLEFTTEIANTNI